VQDWELYLDLPYLQCLQPSVMVWSLGYVCEDLFMVE